jgi:hypothetical protein
MAASNGSYGRIPSNSRIRGRASAIATFSRAAVRRDQRKSLPAPTLPCEAMYSTGKPISRTTGAARESVMKSDSIP